MTCCEYTQLSTGRPGSQEEAQQSDREKQGLAKGWLAAPKQHLVYSHSGPDLTLGEICAHQT